MLAKAKVEKIGEVLKPGRPYRDFLQAIKSTAPVPANVLQREMRTLRERDLERS